jgi:putative tryptophan/tyrosine transport system permease protein
MIVYKLSLVLGEGLIFGILAIGIYIAFQWLRFPDLTPDGSFVLGACAYAKAVLHGAPPIVGLGVALSAGCLAGCCTASVNRLVRIPPVVSGLLVSTALYSAGWLILGRPNQFLDSQFTLVGEVSGIRAACTLLIWLIAITTATITIVSIWGRSYWGLRSRAVGENPLLANDLGVSSTAYTFICLAAANGLVGLSGALFAQRSYSVDINMGVGITIIGLASMILGLALARQRRILTIVCLCIVTGAIIFKVITFLALEAGMPAESFRLLVAILLVGIFLILRVSASDLLRGLKWN